MSAEFQRLLANGAQAFKNADYTQAENWLQAALMEAESMGDELTRALALDNLAEAYYEQGKYDKAEPFYQKALTIREKILPEEHEDIVCSLNNLSALYFNQGKFSEAEPLCKKLVLIYSSTLGAHNPEVASSLRNLALLYKELNKLDLAEEVLRKAVVIMEKSKDTNPSDLSVTFCDLASVYLKMNRNDLALQSYDRSLAILEQAVGKTNEELLPVLKKVLTLFPDKKAPEAEKYRNWLLSIKDASLSPR